MNTAELIYQESKELPEFEAQEVLDFVAFLKQKLKANQEAKPKKESLVTAFEQVAHMELCGMRAKPTCFPSPKLKQH